MRGLAPWATTAASTGGSGGCAAVAAIRWNTSLRAFYQRLRARGKEAKVDLVAVTRKLIVLANTLLQANRLWLDAPPRPSSELVTQGSR